MYIKKFEIHLKINELFAFSCYLLIKMIYKTMFFIIFIKQMIISQILSKKDSIILTKSISKPFGKISEIIFNTINFSAYRHKSAKYV